MKHPQPELLMTVHAAPNEVIAMNAAIGFYRTYSKQVAPDDHHLFCLLLESYLKRLNTELPPTHQGGDQWPQH